MDQGLVAVLAGGVGVLGSLGTSAMAYVAARRQAMDSGKMSHWQMLREERKQAYLSFVSAVQEFHYAASIFPDYFMLRSPGEEIEKARRVAADRLREMYSTCHRVELAGPVELADQVEPIRSDATKIYGRVDDHAGAQGRMDNTSLREYARLLNGLDGRQRDFVRCARSLLEAKPG